VSGGVVRVWSLVGLSRNSLFGWGGRWVEVGGTLFTFALVCVVVFPFPGPVLPGFGRLTERRLSADWLCSRTERRVCLRFVGRRSDGRASACGARFFFFKRISDHWRLPRRRRRVLKMPDLTLEGLYMSLSWSFLDNHLYVRNCR